MNCLDTISTARGILVLAAVLAVAVLIVIPGQAQTFTVLHNFSGGDDGKYPAPGAVDAAGNFYSSTAAGGTRQHNCGGSGCGTVFKLSQKNSHWILNTIYNFTGGNDGVQPLLGPIFGPDGALYGTTDQGGAAGVGTVYKLQPSPTRCTSALCPWNEAILHTFLNGNNDGAYPSAGVTFDSAGNIYGATNGGGGARWCAPRGCGTVYTLTPSHGSWTESLIFAFQGGFYGGLPNSNVVLDLAGNIFGTGQSGAQYGAVFELSNSGSGWSNMFIYQFQGTSDGYNPMGLVIDNTGTLYGTTTSGGIAEGGTAYKLSFSDNQWTFTRIASFMSNNPMNTGPFAPMVFDAQGNLYGTTGGGGLYQKGTLFRLTPSGNDWIYTDLYDFTGGSDGYGPGAVVIDAQGNLYGTAGWGYYGNGVAFKFTP